jgi:formylglycine-generating enzyme required for sulfatase activity
MKALPPGHFAQGATPEPPQPGSAPGQAGEGQAPPKVAALEQPKHSVTIAYPLGIGVYEVTVGEYKDFVIATGRKSAGCTVYDGTWQDHPELSWENVGYRQTATHPVTCVSWRDARDYADWLSKRTGQRYRLPSESEWEYAARAGSPAAHPWTEGANAACGYANIADETAAQRYPGWKVLSCSDGFTYSAPVGTFKPNAFGLYDMLGNVFEWVQDCWNPDYRGAPAGGSAWLTGDCTQHGLRGGSWFTSPSLVAVSSRNRFEETYRSNTVGLRLVREIQP